MYDAIKDDMNWIKALNKNLWTCMSHKIFDYKKDMQGNIEEINNRFKSFSADDKEKSQLKNIIKKILSKDDSSRSLTTNHISRLWMVAEMTYMCWKDLMV